MRLAPEMIEQFWSLVREDSGALVLSFLLLGSLVALAELLHRMFGWPSRASRRVVHAGTGLYITATPYLFSNAAAVYLLGLTFVLINGFTSARGWLRGMHPMRQETRGTVTFPLALLAVLPFCWGEEQQFILQTAFLVLAVADPLAAVVGKLYGRRHMRIGGGAKSPAGSLAFFTTAWLLTSAGLVVFRSPSMEVAFSGSAVLAATLVALVATAVELLGRRGWDNFFIVVSIAVVLTVLQIHPGWLHAMSIGGAAGVLFGLLSWKMKYLTGSGAVAGGLFAATLIGLGGWGWAAPGFTFFFLSSLLSKRIPGWKEPDSEAAARESRRNASQVYANGAAAWLLIVAYAVEPHEWIYWGFVGSLAAAAADTWATEIGPLSHSQPRMILSGRPVTVGTSGAVSWAGTLAGVIGAIVIWAAARWAVPPPAELAGLGVSFITVVGGGVIGSIVDSLAGATIQAVYKDRQTGRIADERERGNDRLQRVHGWPGIDNDVVNVLCTGAGAAASILLTFLL